MSVIYKLVNEYYDNILYDAGDTRNKAVFDSINSTNMGTQNILSMFQKKPKKLAIIMDEIDGLTGNECSGVQELIDIVISRDKTSKEIKAVCPVICTSNNIKEKKLIIEEDEE